MTADFFVSPGGDDHWSGKLPEPNAAKTDGPFATPDAARLAVRQLKSKEPGRDKPVEVLVRGGTYFLSGAIEFSYDDSGTEKAPVVYAAYPGEKPVLSGGVRVTGWKVGPDGRWRVTLADVRDGKWNFAQLFVNGRRRSRPRLPKGDYYRIASRVAPPADDAKKNLGDDRFRFPADTIRADWKNLGDVEVTTFHPWFTSVLRVASVDASAGVVAFTGRTRGAAEYMHLKGGMRFVVDNVAEALGEPGEWYLDRPTGELTYVPMPGEEPDKAEVIAPRLEQVLLLSSGAGKPAEKGEPVGPWVEHVTFRGLTFADTNWVFPPAGSSMPQAAVAVPGAVHARGRGTARSSTAISPAWATTASTSTPGVRTTGSKGAASPTSAPAE